MGRTVKSTPDRCIRCKYCMNLTGCAYLKGDGSTALIACGYSLKTGESRVFKDGVVREGYKHGYCDKYEEGKRVRSRDDMCSHTTLKGSRKKGKNDDRD